MIKKEESKESKEQEENLLQKALEVPEIAEEVKKQAEEKGKRYFLEEKIKNINSDYLNRELSDYRDIEKKEFNELISQREKIVFDSSKFTTNDLEEFNSKIAMAKQIDLEFKRQKELDEIRNRESTPTIQTSSSGLPKDIAEIEKDPSKYEEFKFKNSSNFYLTDDPHKEFESYEKHDLCSIYNDDCKEASITWANEFNQSRLKNKRFQKNFEIITN